MAEAKKARVEVERNVRSIVHVLDLNIKLLVYCFPTAAHVGEIGLVIVAILQELLKKEDERNTATYLEGNTVAIVAYKEGRVLKDVLAFFELKMETDREKHVLLEKVRSEPFLQEIILRIALAGNKKLLDIVGEKLVKKTKNVLRWDDALTCSFEGNPYIRIPMEITSASIETFTDNVQHYPVLRNLKPETVAMFLNAVTTKCRVVVIDHHGDPDDCYATLLRRKTWQSLVELLGDIETLHTVFIPFLENDEKVYAPTEGYKPTTFFTLCKTICNVTTYKEDVEIFEDHYIFNLKN